MNVKLDKMSVKYLFESKDWDNIKESKKKKDLKFHEIIPSVLGGAKFKNNTYGYILDLLKGETNDKSK